MPQLAKNGERRSYPIEMRAVGEGDGRRIQGHAAVFNSLSDEIYGFREIIRPGAFESALAISDVRALLNHDPNLVLGRTKSGTLTLTSDDRGLAVDIIPPDTGYARDLMVSIERGDIDQMSFAFIVARDRWYSDETGFTIREIIEFQEIFDVSPVTYPAYPDTDVSTRTQDALKEFRASQGAAGAGGAGDGGNGSDAGASARTRTLDIADREFGGKL